MRTYVARDLEINLSSSLLKRVLITMQTILIENLGEAKLSCGNLVRKLSGDMERCKVCGIFLVFCPPALECQIN